MSDPVVVTAVFRPVPGQFDAVYEALVPAIQEVHREQGCELYAIHKHPDGNTIVMIEKWESAELLDAHGGGEAVAKLNASIEGKVTGPPEVTRLEPLPVGDSGKGVL